MKKILLLSHFNYSQAGPIHGPVHTLTAYLNRKKNPYVYIGYPLYAGEKSLFIKSNGKKENTKKFGPSFKLNLIFKSLYETWFTLNYLNSNKQDLVVAIDPLNALAALVAKKMGFAKRVIFYTVDYTPKRFPNKLLNSVFHKIDDFCIKNSNSVWNVSNKIVEKRNEQGVPDSKNKYVPNAPSFKAGRPLPGSKVDRYNIMMVTGITHSPAFTMVIDAISALIDKYPKIKLSLIGGGSYEVELKEKVNKSVLKGHVEFLGQLDHETLLKTLPKGGLGLAIYTTDYDWVNYGDSMKAREYLLSGLPTVITDVVSTADDIKKFEAGLIVKPIKKDIEKGIGKILGDKKFWTKTRANAIALSKEQDIDKILNKVFLPEI